MLSRIVRIARPSNARAMSTANVWVNKDTRCIVQGFTGKQVRIHLVFVFFKSKHANNLSIFLIHFLYIFLTLGCVSSFRISHIHSFSLSLSLSLLFSISAGNVPLGAGYCLQQRYSCRWCLPRKGWH